MQNSLITLQIPLNGSRNKFTYNLLLTKDSMFLHNKEEIESKIQIPLKLETSAEFLLNKNKKKLYGVVIVYENKQIHLLGQHQNLLDLKVALANRITFLEIGSFYDPLSNIGRGCSSKVYLANDIISNQRYAIKCMSKKYIQQDGNNNSLKREIDLLESLSSPFIIKIHEFYEGTNTYYFVLDYLEGGNLKNYQNENIQIPLHEIKIIIENLLKALEYIHSHGIMHRDIKPENIMFKYRNDLKSLTIADFGLATLVDLPEFQYIKCGTPGYIAPEIAKFSDQKEKYNQLCDQFSVGVIFYELLTNESLFQGSDWQGVYQQNKECFINFTDLQVDKDTFDLLKRLLEVNPNKRITAQEALQHPFFQEKNKNSQNDNDNQKNEFVFVEESNSNASFEVFGDEEGTASSVPSIQTNLIGSFVMKQRSQPRTSSINSIFLNDFNIDENFCIDSQPLKILQMQIVTPKMMPKSSSGSYQLISHKKNNSSDKKNSEDEFVI